MLEASAAAPENAAPAGYVVLVTVNRRFLHMFDLWFRYYADTGIRCPLHVAAIGRAAQAAMLAHESRGHPLVVHPLEAGRGSVTVRRLRVLKKLLDRGLDVVSTDLDAFWLSKRTLELADRRFDVQMSVAAYAWPPAATAAWGFSLCCGFSIIHSNASTRRLMDEWIAKSVRSDQYAFNHILLEHGTRWKHAGAVKGNQGACCPLDLTLQAIDYRCVTRARMAPGGDNSRLVVFHPRLVARTEEMRVLQSIAHLRRLGPRRFLWAMAIRASLRAARRWVVSMFVSGTRSSAP